MLSPKAEGGALVLCSDVPCWTLGPPWSGQWTVTPGEPSGWDRETQSPGMVVWGMQVGWNHAGNGLGA